MWPRSCWWPLSSWPPTRPASRGQQACGSAPARRSFPGPHRPARARRWASPPAQPCPCLCIRRKQWSELTSLRSAAAGTVSYAACCMTLSPLIEVQTNLCSHKHIVPSFSTAQWELSRGRHVDCSMLSGRVEQVAIG